MSQAFYARFFAALYLGESWYDFYRRKGSVHARARAVVLFDRVMAGELDVVEEAVNCPEIYPTYNETITEE